MQDATGVGDMRVVVLQPMVVQLLPLLAVCAVQEDTYAVVTFGPWQVTVWPPDELGVQELAPTKPVSVVWHWVAVPTVKGDVGDGAVAVQELLFVQALHGVY